MADSSDLCVQEFKIGDRVKNPSDHSDSPYVFIIKSVNGKTYTVQKENTSDAAITYQEHEIEKVDK